MNAVAGQVSHICRRARPLVFFLGAALLLAGWAVLFESESLFTESHLVGYYCCVTEHDLPARGTLARSISDFFRTLPGKYLPSLLFVSINAAIFVSRSRRGRRDIWLPFVFLLLSAIYLQLDIWLVRLSWSISDSIVGPLTSPYKGYQHTWYGIVLHLLLWSVYFAVLARVSRLRQRRTKPPA